MYLKNHLGSLSGERIYSLSSADDNTLSLSVGILIQQQRSP